MAENIVTLDYGSHTTKAGYAHSIPSDSEPRVVVPTTVLADTAGAAGTQQAIWPIQDGFVRDWDALEVLLQDILYEQLGWVAGDEGGLLVAEPAFTSKGERERLTQLVFEQFGVTGLFLCDAAVLSLYSLGRVTGCVVDIGHGKTDVATAMEGQLHGPGQRRVPIGPATLARELELELEARGIKLSSPEALTALRERLVRLAESPAELAAAQQQAGGEPEKHTLPDGQVIEVAPALGLRLGETLLQGGSTTGPAIAEAVVSAATSHADAASRKVALEGVLVCGGGSCVANLTPRLMREVRQLLPPSLQPIGATVPEYMPENTLRHSAWMGGAILSKVVFQQGQHVNKFDYDEIGPTALHRKCA